MSHVMTTTTSVSFAWFELVVSIAIWSWPSIGGRGTRWIARCRLSSR